MLNSALVQPDQSAPSPASTTLSPADTPLSPAARILWTLLILAILGICYFSHLGALGFVGPDEPRYAWIARDMAESGDWITPRLYGKPWFEKPVLYYWGAAAAFKLFGVSETAARLPSAIAALLATLALAWLALRLYGAETARWLLLLLPTSVGMLGFSHAAATDMPFSAMLTIAMVCAAVILGLTKNQHTPVLPSTPWLALLLFGFFLGLAVLAKGPAAIILCGGAVFFWALFTYRRRDPRWRDAFRLLHPVAIAAFCAAALPWYILCARRNPDFFRVFIIEHNLKRFLTPEFQHIQPFWFYVPVLLVAFLPWTALLLWSSIEGTFHLARTRHIQPHTLFFLTWAAFCVVFFSISQSKLPGYILPALPAIGILLAKDLASRLQSGHALRLLCSSLGATLFVLAGAATRLIVPAPAVSQLIMLFAAGGIAAVASAWYRRSTAAIVVAAIVFPVSLLALSGGLGELDERVSARVAANETERLFPGIETQAVASYKLPRGLNFGLSFYLRREVPEWKESENAPAIVFTNYRGSLDLKKVGVYCPDYIEGSTIWICGKAMQDWKRGSSGDGREAHQEK